MSRGRTLAGRPRTDEGIGASVFMPHLWPAVVGRWDARARNPLSSGRSAPPAFGLPGKVAESDGEMLAGISPNCRSAGPAVVSDRFSLKRSASRTVTMVGLPGPSGITVACLTLGVPWEDGLGDVSGTSAQSYERGSRWWY